MRLVILVLGVMTIGFVLGWLAGYRAGYGSGAHLGEYEQALQRKRRVLEPGRPPYSLPEERQ